MANYTCVAENVAGKRVAEQAMLTVYGKQFFMKCLCTHIFSHWIECPKSVSYLPMWNDFSKWRLEFLVAVVRVPLSWSGSRGTEKDQGLQ